MTETSSYNFLLSEPSRQGLVYIFTGDGKGKTSAALGLVFRASGHGLRVYFSYFMKGGYPQGEHDILSKLPNVNVASFGQREFIDPASIKLQDIEQARQALSASSEAMLSNNYDLVVLDEVNLAVAWKLIELDEVIKLITDKPKNVELILTGRQADVELVKLADVVTEMLNIKYPHNKEAMARMGIDY
jgi:cob(I)alamin adenosyltransferase